MIASLKYRELQHKTVDTNTFMVYYKFVIQPYDHTILQMIKRTPSLTEQAKSLIKQRILNQEFNEGRIPSETDLADELGVSRTTIRDALNRLELEGTIFRKQGAGTFVNETSLQIHTRLEEIWAYESMLEAHGYAPTNKIISVEEQLPGDELAADLNLSANDTVLTIKKLFLADNQPVIYTINHIPARILTCEVADDDFHQPIYRVMSDMCRQELAYYLSEIIPLVTPGWLADTLQLSREKNAILSFEEIGYNVNNKPILKAQSYFRDDLLRLRLIRREAK